MSERKCGDLPLHEHHMCFPTGHSMFSVYTLGNQQSEWGLNKCSRCGWEDYWQYDFVGGSNTLISKLNKTNE